MNLLFIVLLILGQAPNNILSQIFLAKFPVVHLCKLRAASQHLTDVCYIAV